jgi:hypothetical protein
MSMGSAYLTVPRTVKITIATTLAGKFNDYLRHNLMLTFKTKFRFSERDILMRYHWGQGVGHFHAHQPSGTSFHTSEELDAGDAELRECETEERLNEDDGDVDGNSDVGIPHDPELGLEDREYEGWDEEEDGEGGGSEEDMEEDMEEEDFTGI